MPLNLLQKIKIYMLIYCVSDDFAEIDVKDEGIGISKKDKDVNI